MEIISITEYDGSRPTTGRNARTPKYDWGTILGSCLDDDGDAVAAVRLHRSTYHTADDGTRIRLEARDFDVKPATMLKAARDAVDAAGLKDTLSVHIDTGDPEAIVIGPKRERPTAADQDEATADA